MSFHSVFWNHLPTGRLFTVRTLLLTTLVLGACTTQATRDAELAAQEAAILAEQQDAARLEQETARRQAALERRRGEVVAAAQARLQAREQATRERQAAQARAREDAERRAREEADRLESVRIEVLARVEAERQEKLQRIAELEQQIAGIESTATNDAATNEILLEAVAVAEQLVDALTEEQLKYENTDADGNTVQPLSKELIAELEDMKNDLVRQASSQQ
jgi:hypothetical protein